MPLSLMYILGVPQSALLPADLSHLFASQIAALSHWCLYCFNDVEHAGVCVWEVKRLRLCR